VLHPYDVTDAAFRNASPSLGPFYGLHLRGSPVKSVFNIFLALFLGLLLFDGTAFAQQIQSMKLLTPQVGWAQSGQHLYWTTDGGSHWKDITPIPHGKRTSRTLSF